MKTLSVTFIQFSPNGSELLVNLGGEQLYLFDMERPNVCTGNYKFKSDYYKTLFSEDLIEPVATSTKSSLVQEQQTQTDEINKK